ncbi:hypothetical protein KBP30_25685 [Streptomyces sp. Go40/10]|uniref:hypothetical protein n=1 Tax=Streptomyces sp. Go40/10 TaxID=2825844 RepID=UPI001E5F925E|nr:hypothetical protein [Streptomyces sp. Go40/10]UFR04348.1 hypothetical protein KBP30_25685 [Streptomyces sp. Go40/10]
MREEVGLVGPRTLLARTYPRRHEHLNQTSVAQSSPGGGTDRLITTEFRRSTGGAPVVRWPLDSTDALLDTDGTTNYRGSVHATAGYRTPVWAVQGAATDGTYFYFSGTCPEYADRDPKDSATADLPYCIHWAKPGASPHVLTYGPPLIQNLSWAPSSGRLWGINERIAAAPGVRSVFSLDPPN